MQINHITSRRTLKKHSSGTMSNAGMSVLGSLDRADTFSTFRSDKDIGMIGSISSRDGSRGLDTPLVEYYKNRDRYPDRIQKTSQFAPPGMKTVMSPIFKKSIDENSRLYSSIGNGSQYTTFTPRTYGTSKFDLSKDLPSVFDKNKVADIAMYKNGDKNTFNDSHLYLGFSSTKRKELASSFKLPQSYQDELYKDTESVNGQYDKPNHVNE
jgi:hypothetical protein